MMRTVLFTVVAFGCASVAAAQQGRVLVETDWTLIGEVEAGVESPLLLPVLLAGGNGMACVFDYGDHAVKCFDIAGRMLWRFGRSGRGPREFANPTDLKIDRLGRVWVLDPTNMRLTILSAAGSVDQSLRLPAGLVRIAPHADSMTQLSEPGRAAAYLGEVATWNSFLAQTALRYLVTDMGDAGLPILRRLYETGAVVEPTARENIVGIAATYGWRQ